MHYLLEVYAKVLVLVCVICHQGLDSWNWMLLPIISSSMVFALTMLFNIVKSVQATVSVVYSSLVNAST